MVIEMDEEFESTRRRKLVSAELDTDDFTPPRRWFGPSSAHDRTVAGFTGRTTITISFSSSSITMRLS